ncbi:MAG: glycosyltransferase family 39 protein [Chthoniobacteraceae bacterium]
MNSPRVRSAIFTAIVFVLAFDVAWFWQRQAGAYGSEFGGHPDEAAHYVTGLFVRDAIAALPRCASARSLQPLKPFADQNDPAGFYAHYPKVALGVWPPAFYLAQATWTSAFGTHRLPILLLMTALAAALATQLFAALRVEYGGWLAAIGALALVSVPLVIEHYSMIMAELLTAIFMFGAAAAWGRFLDGQRSRDAIYFGVLAGFAIMTKGTAIALALHAPLALALTGRWRLLTRPALWIGAATVAITAGPWTWIFRDKGREVGGWLETSPSWHFTRDAAPYYLGKLGLALGVLLLVLACLGVVMKVLRPGLRPGLWASAGALIIAVLGFQMLLPVGLEARHLVSVLPAVIMFSIAGLDALRDAYRHRKGLPSSEPSPLAIAVFAVVVAGGVLLAHRIAPPDPKRWSGFAAIAEAVLNDPQMKGRPVLVSSDATGEGMFISEIAMRDHRPGAVVLRANKELASMDWAGRGIATKFHSDEELIAWIKSSGVGALVVDPSMPEAKRGAHHDQLILLCETHSELFWPASSSPIVRGGETHSKPIRLYLVRRPAN